MSISIDLPGAVEESLRREMGDLERVAKEALAIEAYRAAKLSLGQFAELLDLSTYDAEGLLKSRNVYLDFSEEELSEERAALSRLLGQ